MLNVLYVTKLDNFQTKRHLQKSLEIDRFIHICVQHVAIEFREKTVARIATGNFIFRRSSHPNRKEF